MDKRIPPREPITISFEHPQFTELPSDYLDDAPLYTDRFPNRVGLGMTIFNHVIIRDSCGVWTLPLERYGCFWGYVFREKDDCEKITSYALIHTSTGFAWIYDDTGIVTKYYADVIEFYEIYDGFIIKLKDKEENIDGRETAENN